MLDKINAIGLPDLLNKIQLAKICRDFMEVSQRTRRVHREHRVGYFSVFSVYPLCSLCSLCYFPNKRLRLTVSLRQLYQGNLRQNSNPARIPYESISTIDIKFLISFFIKSHPLAVNILYRTPAEPGNFHAKLHTMCMAGKHQVNVWKFRSYLCIPMRGIMTEK